MGKIQCESGERGCVGKEKFAYNSKVDEFLRQSGRRENRHDTPKIDVCNKLIGHISINIKWRKMKLLGYYIPNFGSKKIITLLVSFQ